MFETETDETETGALVCDVCGSDVPLTMQLALIDGANVCESCLSETDEIMDDDWTTDDGNRFYQNGKLILDASDMTDKQAARAAALVMTSTAHYL